MDEQKNVETSVNVEDKDTKVVDTTEKVDGDNKTELKAEENVKEEEKTADNKGEEETAENGKEDTAVVEQVDPVGNGVRVEDLVTREDLAERLAAFEAKLDAVLKENQSLKDKYENKDFGNITAKGVQASDPDAEDSFEAYSKRFM